MPWPQPLDERLPPRRVKALIGDVMMISADLEMLLCLAYCQLKNLDARQHLSALSRRPITKKIARLRELVAAGNDAELIEQYRHFERVSEPFLDLRNTFAHGRYTGTHTNANNEAVFVFLNPYEPEEQEKHAAVLSSMLPNAVGMIFQNTTESMMQDAVRDGSVVVANIRTMFGVKYLHEQYPAVLRTNMPIGD